MMLQDGFFPSYIFVLWYEEPLFILCFTLKGKYEAKFSLAANVNH
jgi:hypothetical protein